MQDRDAVEEELSHSGMPCARERYKRARRRGATTSPASSWAHLCPRDIQELAFLQTHSERAQRPQAKEECMLQNFQQPLYDECEQLKELHKLIEEESIRLWTKEENLTVQRQEKEVVNIRITLRPSRRR
uniref:Uncharacterized protein n=2 Tax=Hyaloperonospora arabidopsidis (strain Emoy2) TaxID=559515 RepID=M4BUX8_HYAAE